MEKEKIIIAGPCAVESESQLRASAKIICNKGINILRGGAYKPRTSYESFQGLGFEGVKILHRVGKDYNLKVVTEIVDIEGLHLSHDYIDFIQIGARNMYNYSLLKEVGKSRKPIILKRGLSATIEEWIKASEYIMNNGNENIIFCERGIRTFETYTRNTLDLSSVPIIKKCTGKKIIVDPSHATGRKDLILPMSKAALACGADGLMVEVHNDPINALSDGMQSLNKVEFESFIDNLHTAQIY